MIIFTLLFQGAVQVLAMIQEILPPLSELNCQQQARLASGEHLFGGDSMSTVDGNTPGQHYTVVESEHPYKPATVANYKVGIQTLV